MYRIIATLLIITTSYASIAQDNMFTGAANNDWDNDTNWTNITGPLAIVNQMVIISANTQISSANTTDYHFVEGSVLDIDSGTTLTNNGTGTWNFEGTLVGNGTHAGSFVVEGAIEPGPFQYEFTCGNILTYGGQDYATVQIGSQCWMAENMNVGTMIDGNWEPIQFDLLEKYCYNNDSTECDTYGGLYSWAEMMGHTYTTNQGVCPIGWHVPTDEEWMQLEGEVDSQYGYPDPVWEQTNFRGSDVAIKLKSTTTWDTGAGTDDFGFNALAAGKRDPDASGPDYLNQGSIAHFWTSSVFMVAFAKERHLWGMFDNAYRGTQSGGMGYSLRCIRD